MSVWWQKARPGSIRLLLINGLKWLHLDTDRLRHIHTGEGEERETERELNELAQSSLSCWCWKLDAVSRSPCLSPMNQCDICLWQPIKPQETQSTTKMWHIFLYHISRQRISALHWTARTMWHFTFRNIDALLWSSTYLKWNTARDADAKHS